MPDFIGGTDRGRDQFVVSLRCRKCSQSGFAVWEKNTLISPPDPEPTLISLEGFYERVANKPPYAMQLACNTCKTIQRE